MVGLKRDGDVLRGTCDKCGKPITISMTVDGNYCGHPIFGDCSDCLIQFERGESAESASFSIMCDDENCRRCVDLRECVEKLDRFERMNQAIEQRNGLTTPTGR